MISIVSYFCINDDLSCFIKYLFFTLIFVGNLGERLGQWPIGVFMSNDGGVTWTKVTYIYMSSKTKLCHT